MNPNELGKKYDKIAAWWDQQHKQSFYGVQPLRRALKFKPKGNKALDIGCGSGGRLIKLLEQHDYDITGIDVSEAMLHIAKLHHPNSSFVQQDICTWQTNERYDFIVAWDSIFHVPFKEQNLVIDKICNLLKKDGVLIYTFGDAIGEHTDEWRDDIFYYSSIGIKQNTQQLLQNNLSLLHLEIDQKKHVFVIAKKL